MSNDFDQFPTYDPILKDRTNKMSGVWADFMSTFYMNLIGYLSQNGIFIPQLTTAQRDAIQSPVEGQMIYHVDATPGSPGTRVAEIEVWQTKGATTRWWIVTTT